MNWIQKLAIRVRHNEEGQTFVEYALLVGLVVLGLATVFGGLDDALKGVVDEVDDLLPNVDA